VSPSLTCAILATSALGTLLLALLLSDRGLWGTGPVDRGLRWRWLVCFLLFLLGFFCVGLCLPWR
jgi:hypothetical protein